MRLRMPLMTPGSMRLWAQRRTKSGIQTPRSALTTYFTMLVPGLAGFSYTSQYQYMSFMLPESLM